MSSVAVDTRADAHGQKHLGGSTRSSVVSAAVVSILASSGVHAADPPPASADVGTLSEVTITTARLRSETLQEAGLSVSAFSGDDLERRGLDDFKSIALRTPGLEFSDRGPNKNNVSIRGLSNSILATNFQRNNSLVGIYLDDVSVVTAFSTQREFNTYDLERVEVVKGPQGTLYGEGAMGGAIRYTTASPTLDAFGAKSRATLSQTRGASDPNWRIDGSLNFPVSGTFGLRLTAYTQEDAGFIDYTGAAPVPGAVLDGVPAKDANGGDSSGVRVVALAKPSEAFTARLMLNYEEARTDTEWVLTDDASRLVNTHHFALEPQNDDVLVGSLRLDWKASGGTWTSVTGYVDRQRKDRGFDPGFTNSFNSPGTKVFDIEEKAFSQELRFASDLSGPLNFLLGAYYKDTDTAVDLLISSALPSAPGRALDEDESYQGKQYAVFGELTYSVSERLTATVGARYFKEDVDSVQIWNEPDPGTILAGIPTIRVDDTISISQVLPKASLEFRQTEDLLWYANVAKGARNGGLSFTSSVTLSNAFGFPVRNAYDEDSAWSYEFGMKSQWLDRRLTLNSALYYLDWRNVQAEFVTQPFGFQVIANAGDASSKGAEVELAYEPTDRFGLRLGASWTDAQFDEDYISNAVTGARVLKGTRMPFSPEFTVSGGVDVRWPVGNLIATASLEYQHNAEQAGQVRTVPEANPAVPYYEVDAFGIASARAALRGERWGVTLFANNLFDENVALFRAVSNIYAPGGNFYVNRPRTFGVTFDVEF